MTHRKHVHEHEIPDVAVILREKLIEMVPLHDPESYLSTEEQNVLHVLYRFENHRRGKPAYPTPETWGTLAAYLGVMVPLQSIDGILSQPFAPSVEPQPSASFGIVAPERAGDPTIKEAE